MVFKSARRVRTPTVLQLEAVECGAAALAIMLGYFGRIVPLPELRRACGVSRDGSRASSMVKAARGYGLEAAGYSMSAEAVRSQQAPFIVFWNFNHFLVVEGFSRDKVHINDPASGHYTVSQAEFDDSFTGVVLTMRPGPEFRQGGQRPSMVQAIAHRLRGSWDALAYCIVAGFLLVLPGLAIPAFMQVYIDSVIIEQRTDWLRPLLLAILAAMLLQAVLRWWQLQRLRQLKLSLSVRLAGGFMRHLLNLPALFYAQRFAGEVANRSQLNDKLADALSGRLAQTAIDALMALFYAALMLFYDVILTLIGVGFALLNVVVLRRVSARRSETNMRVQQEYGKARGMAIAGLQSMETLKASGSERDFFGTWSGYYTKGVNARQEMEMANQSLTILPDLLSALTVMAVLVVGGMRIIQGELSIGMLVAFQSLMMSFMLPINGLVNLGGLLQELRGDLARLDDVLAYPVSADTAPQAEPEEPLRLKGFVEVDRVSFGYNPLEPPLIEDFSVLLRPGERVALVGASGSGKTTLSRLIQGEYQPWSGEIRLDERPRAKIPREILVNSFATVDQEIVLFGGTVRDNLTLWDPSVPERDLIRACEDAAILDTVLALPGGFDAELLESGANLSGGQRQRLELARALINNPTILILDEATSALDAETERIIIERLRMRGCACIVIAHRLSTIRDCDEIIVLDRGRVVERGDHASLVASDAAYAALLRGAGEWQP